MVNTRTCASKDHRSSQLPKCKQNFKTFFLDFSSENRFVAGTKSGHVAIWNGNSIEKSTKLFTNMYQYKNATLVQYSGGKIYAVAEDSCVTVLDMNLRVEKDFGQKNEETIYAFVATPDYVAVGGLNNKVTVYNKRGDILLVNYAL